MDGYVKNYIYGAISGSSAAILTHPFLNLKTVIQDGKSVTKNMLTRKWLYEGMTKAMIGYSAEKMLVFGTYNSLRSHDINPTIAGAIAGVAAAFSATPTEQLIIDAKNKIRCYRPGHLYAAFPQTAMREVVGFSVHFTIYDALSENFNKERDSLKTMLCGATAVICGWTVIIPIDKIKTQIQTGTFNWATYKLSHSYVGLRIALLRAIPYHTACFSVNEWLLKLC